jgi:hypothetical protein
MNYYLHSLLDSESVTILAEYFWFRIPHNIALKLLTKAAPYLENPLLQACSHGNFQEAYMALCMAAHDIASAKE